MFNSYPPASLFGTHVRTLTSSIVGREYQLSVWVPQAYADSEKTYPVVYVLDGNTKFGVAVETTDALIFGKEIPEVILVGIGVPMKSYADWLSHRNRDYTPTMINDVPGSGGAAKFLSFIEIELIPWVSKNYRVDHTNQNLCGHSLCGLFALYALLQNPSLFRSIMAESPALEWDQQAAFQLEEVFSLSHHGLRSTLYISVGTEEKTETQLVQDFWATLKKRNYEGLKLITELLQDETHMSGWARAYVNGLKAVFQTSV